MGESFERRDQEVIKSTHEPEILVAKNSRNRRRAFAVPLADNLTRRAPKESKETQNRYLKFPSGLRLRLAHGNVINGEWMDTSPTPMQCFSKKFPDKKVKDVEGDCRDWIDGQYIDRVPVVKIRPGDLNKKISKYLRVRDLVKIDMNDKTLMTRAGTWAKHERFMIHHKDGQYYWNVARIDPNLCKILDKIRDKSGVAFTINEGVRPEIYNEDMYKAKREAPVYSPHSSGRAVDVSRTGNAKKDAKLFAAIENVLKGKGGGLGDGPTVYHIDIKIQNGKSGQKGSWIIDKNTGKVKLRLRRWHYGRGRKKRS